MSPSSFTLEGFFWQNLALSATCFVFYLVHASLIQWFNDSIVLILFSLHRKVTWIIDICCVENSAGSCVPKRSTRNPFQDTALIWTAFLPLLLHGTSLLSLKCLPTYVYFVQFNFSFQLNPPAPQQMSIVFFRLVTNSHLDQIATIKIA